MEITPVEMNQKVVATNCAQEVEKENKLFLSKVTAFLGSIEEMEVTVPSPTHAMLRMTGKCGVAILSLSFGLAYRDIAEGTSEETELFVFRPVMFYTSFFDLEMYVSLIELFISRVPNNKWEHFLNTHMLFGSFNSHGRACSIDYRIDDTRKGARYLVHGEVAFDLVMDTKTNDCCIVQAVQTSESFHTRIHISSEKAVLLMKVLINVMKVEEGQLRESEMTLTSYIQNLEKKNLQTEPLPLDKV